MNDFKLAGLNDIVIKDINISDYAEIEKTIRSITPPYEPFKKPIRLADMVEILDDIWEDDE